MEAALDAEGNESALPDPLGPTLRAGARIAREAAGMTGQGQKDALEAALKQLQIPPRVFVPVEVSRAAESARVLVDRARRAQT